MSFTHRYCCCGGCPTRADEGCVGCEDAVANQFTLVSSSITMCSCLLPPGGGFYADYSGLDVNMSLVVDFDTTSGIVGDCQWYQKADDADPLDLPLYSASDCTGFSGNLGARRSWLIYRTATKWIVEGHIDVGTGSTRNWYGVFFYAEQDVAEGDCLGPSGAFTNSLGSCGDNFATGRLFDAGNDLNGSTDYVVVGTGGSVTITCYTP